MSFKEIKHGLSCCFVELPQSGKSEQQINLPLNYPQECPLIVLSNVFGWPKVAINILRELLRPRSSKPHIISIVNNSWDRAAPKLGNYSLLHCSVPLETLRLQSILNPKAVPYIFREVTLFSWNPPQFLKSNLKTESGPNTPDLGIESLNTLEMVAIFYSFWPAENWIFSKGLAPSGPSYS